MSNITLNRILNGNFLVGFFNGLIFSFALAYFYFLRPQLSELQATGSYAYGQKMGTNLSQHNIPVSARHVFAGIHDALKTKNRLSADETKKGMDFLHSSKAHDRQSPNSAIETRSSNQHQWYIMRTGQKIKSKNSALSRPLNEYESELDSVDENLAIHFSISKLQPMQDQVADFSSTENVKIINEKIKNFPVFLVSVLKMSKLTGRIQMLVSIDEEKNYFSKYFSSSLNNDDFVVQIDFKN